MIERGDLASDQIYTATMAFPSSVMLNEEKDQRAIEILEDGQALVNEGRIQIASYTEVRSIWQIEYDAEPSILSYDQIDPEEYTCDEE
jgi:hypothetical protein